MKQLTRTLFTFVLLLTAAVSMAETDAEPRQSLSSEGTDIQRGRTGPPVGLS